MQTPVRLRFHQQGPDMRRRLCARVGALVLLLIMVSHHINAVRAAFRLDSPTTGSISVAGEFRLSGVCDYDELLVSLWRPEAVYTTIYAQQRITVQAGRFDTWIWLPWGTGEYTVQVWGRERGADAYVQLTTFPVRVTSGTRSIQALPVKLEAFDAETDSILQPLQAYGQVPGRTALHIKTKYAHLVLEIHKDGVSEDYWLPATQGEIRTELWLARGAGRYDIVLWAPTSTGGSYAPWAAFAVDNVHEENLDHLPQAPLWYNAAWQGGKSMLQIENLAALYGGTQGISSGRLQLTGRTEYKYLSATVEKDGAVARYKIPVLDGNFTADLWLRFGPGMHMVTIWADDTGQGRLQALVRFTARSAAPDTLLYLAPSRGIESDHPIIAQLAAEITKNATGDLQRVLAIHDWVADNISYDVAKYKSGLSHPDDGALRTLQRRQGVCQDYAYLTTALLRAVGIPARLAIGQAYSFGAWGAHAWTEAYAAGRWIVLDTTWDAGYVTDTGRFVKQSSHRYFDPAASDFARDHILEYYDY
jgi:transglutaminase-like putative cysteine protease